MCLFRKHISLLIGAGFSAAAGYPLASNVNQKVVNTRNNNFHWNASGNLVQVPQGYQTQYGGYYLVLLKAIDYYLSLHNCVMDYEKFYDFLEGPIKSDSTFRSLCASIPHVDFDQALSHLCILYNQIIFEYIQPYKPCDHHEYDIFREWLTKTKRKKTIHIHTLNHDLFLEHCILRDDYSDGFSNRCSKYYAENVLQNSTIRLQKFNNLYRKNIRLYKLHGSFDQYFCETKTKRHYVKVPYGYDSNNITDKDGRIHNYNFCPEFLTGTTKDKHYDEIFYGKLFSHFEKNLRRSESVIIIGYGGKDLGINKMLTTVQKKHKLIYIDPYPNNIFIQAMQTAGWQVKQVNKTVEQLSLEDFEV